MKISVLVRPHDPLVNNYSLFYLVFSFYQLFSFFEVHMLSDKSFAQPFYLCAISFT